MDKTAIPVWGYGCEPVPINTLPASFVTFFPAAAAAATTNVEPKDISWADNFVARRAHTRQPAWCRVAVQAHPSTLRKGSIMKRIGVSTRNPTSAVGPRNGAPAAAPEAPSEPARRVRRKLQPSRASEQDHKLSGAPPSEAEITSSIMRAKVDVSNFILSHSTAKLFLELRESKTRAYTKKTIPTKRRFTEFAASIDLEYANGGNRILTYIDLSPILAKAHETGVDKVDVHMASIASASANLQSARRDPRIHLAAAGMPELADITDLTEPESPLALAKPSKLIAGAKSPTKKASPLSSSPVRGSPGRLKETIVRLLPTASPKVEPSPTKSSAPSTPLRDSPRTGGTPSIISRSHMLPQSPLQQQSSEAKTPSSVRLLQGPFKNFVSPSLKPAQQSPAVRESPAKVTRPVAPTPSKWNRLEPSTLYQMFTPVARSPTTSQNDSSLGLLASVPSFIRDNLSPIRPIMSDPMNIDFGTTSPSFDHASWLNSPVSAGEVERTKILRRRKSEPLIRNCLIAQTRRKSLSPQKLVTQSDNSKSDNSKSDNSQVENNSATTLLERNPDAAETANQTLTNTGSANVTMNDSTSATPIYSQYIKSVRPTTTDSPTPTGRSSTGDRGARKNGIFDIDMRENPDIFGAQAPIMSSSSAVEQLAEIAKARCNDEAKVFVTEENGRLIVRFKLSMEYASMFPESQGPDESRFTISPSISSSPRIRFQSQNVSHLEPTFMDPDQSEVNHLPYGRDPTLVSDVESSPQRPADSAMDKTLVVSDFGSSPQKPANSNEMDKTLVVSDFGSSPRRPVNSEMDKTLVVSDFGSSPQQSADKSAATTSSTQEEANTSSPVAASNTFDDTTAMSFPSFTVADYDTTIPGMTGSPSNASKTPERTDSPSPLSELGSTPNNSTGLGITDITPTPAQASTVGAAATPTLNASFTPVNQNARSQTSTPSSALSAKPKENEAPEKETATSSKAPNHDNDSPGREYMREFIKRSRPKRLSTTTDTGSPIAQPKRQPLGIKSPNMESPQRGKRKFESDGSENESETIKQETEPAPKRVRRLPKATSRKAATESKPADEAASAMNAEETVEAPESADAQEETEPDNAPAARRSSRLQTKSATASKSSIPTAIKVGRGRGASSALNSVRNEQQELNQQTRMNTRKNKGDAEYPAQVLARCSEEAQEDVPEQQEAQTAKGRRGKSVNWREPIAAFQDDKSKKGKAAPKSKAKPETNRVAKPAPKATAATRRQQTARVAAGLGMAGNGTPAKRLTRSSAKSAK